jgi:hypothetical protein
VGSVLCEHQYAQSELTKENLTTIEAALLIDTGHIVPVADAHDLSTGLLVTFLASVWNLLTC